MKRKREEKETATGSWDRQQPRWRIREGLRGVPEFGTFASARLKVLVKEIFVEILDFFFFFSFGVLEYLW
ncbi:hypothetical protein EUGRSUZ_E01970 [Eucalyptus grandis]|uniref:Uncharacterized protein n=2 Tax=Eucalyptus grandis TaxID=71139 RepID=A0A059C562_EUCGR|nr:hypothetical protein EUGRSUZ_E01970 [Eucalyptus grandis]